MSEKAVFVLGQPTRKKHSVQFTMIELESSDGWKPENATTPSGWRPTFYLPRPFAENARKVRVTLETIDE